jgi:polyhydroxybutyrate depolymerase
MVKFVAYALALTLSLGAAAKAAADTITIDTDFGSRDVIVKRAGSGPRPTILVLHGARGSGQSAASRTGFAEAAARHGFTAVFPSGIGHRWHYGPSVEGSDPDDFGFLHALIKQLVDKGISDPARFYIAGVSNGGMMTFALACKQREQFAGVATIIANMPAELEGCSLGPSHYVMVNSTADPWMPFAGGGTGQFHGGGQVLGAERTEAMLQGADGCASETSEALPHRSASGETSVKRETWQQCKPGASLTFYRVENGGHTVPGTSSASDIFGPTNQDFNAAEAIVSEFAHEQ